jgi:hypothetical protein
VTARGALATGPDPGHAGAGAIEEPIEQLTEEPMPDAVVAGPMTEQVPEQW